MDVSETDPATGPKVDAASPLATHPERQRVSPWVPHRRLDLGIRGTLAFAPSSQSGRTAPTIGRSRP
jgi:hypothetical protein